MSKKLKMAKQYFGFSLKGTFIWRDIYIHIMWLSLIHLELKLSVTFGFCAQVLKINFFGHKRLNGDLSQVILPFRHLRVLYLSSSLSFTFLCPCPCTCSHVPAYSLLMHVCKTLLISISFLDQKLITISYYFDWHTQ